MSLTTVNSAILIPTPPDWSNQVNGGRRWEVRSSQALDGSEDRIGVRYNPLKSLQFTPKLMTQEERSRFFDRVRAAVKLGQAAVPDWGRGRVLDGNVTGTALVIESTSQAFSVGDYVLFLDWATDPENWDCIQISAKASATNYTLGSSVSRTYSSGAYIWPILFGRVEVNDAELIDDYRGMMQLSFMEPQGSGELLDTATSCGAAPTASSAGALTFCEGSITLSVETSGCAGAYDLSWTALPYADQYVIKKGPTGGPYSTTVATVSTLSYSVTRSWLDDDYYVVVGQIGSYEVQSNEVTVPALTVERMMRALQERYYIAFGSFYSWPSSPFDRVSDGTHPGNYPSDGFYDADLPDATRETNLLQGMFDVLVASPFMLHNYCDVDDDTYLTDIDANSELLYFCDALGANYRAPFNVLPYTVTSGTRVADASVMASLLCKLQYLPIEIVTGGPAGHGQMIFGTYEVRTYSVPGPSACDAFLAVAPLLNAGWEAASWVTASSGSGPGPWDAGVYCEILPDGTGKYVGNIVSYRWILESPMTAYGTKGLQKLYMAFTTRNLAGGPVPYFAGNNPPNGWPIDETFKVLEETTPAGTDWESATYANQKPIIPGGIFTLGWKLLRSVLLVIKKQDPDLAHWTYYP